MINFGFINSDDMDCFYKQYPMAYHFLLKCSLENEYKHLKKQNKLNSYEINRLKELNDLLQNN
jgi:hypothetical protein